MKKLYLIIVILFLISSCKENQGGNVAQQGFEISKLDSPFYYRAGLVCFLQSLDRLSIHDFSCNKEPISSNFHTLELVGFYDTINPGLNCRVKIFEFMYKYEHSDGRICYNKRKERFMFFKNDLDSLGHILVERRGDSSDDFNPVGNIFLSFSIPRTFDSISVLYLRSKKSKIGSSMKKFLLANGYDSDTTNTK